VTLADNQRPVEFIVLLSIVVPLIVLGVLCWIFWRARHND
jgi:ABC-type spermidine/putrescine transport system permease subunit II